MGHNGSISTSGGVLIMFKNPIDAATEQLLPTPNLNTQMYGQMGQSAPAPQPQEKPKGVGEILQNPAVSNALLRMGGTILQANGAGQAFGQSLGLGLNAGMTEYQRQQAMAEEKKTAEQEHMFKMMQEQRQAQEMQRKLRADRVGEANKQVMVGEGGEMMPNEVLQRMNVQKALAGRTSINNNVSSGQGQFPALGKFQEEIAKGTAAQVNQGVEDNELLARQNASYATAVNLLDQNPDMYVGVGAEGLNRMKGVFANAGLLSEEAAKEVGNFSVLASRIQDNTMDKTQKLKGALSDKESERAETAAGAFGTTPDGLKNTMRLNTRLNEIEIDRNNRKQEFAFKNNGSLSGFNKWYQAQEDRPTVDESFLTPKRESKRLKFNPETGELE